MKRVLLAAFASLLIGQPSVAGDISSAYTDIDTDKNCSIFSANEEGGEFANFVCDGWRGYPVLIFSGDLRESVLYGFPAKGRQVWESFSAFNSTGPKIEWRIDTEGSTSIPFATIHRWFVSDDPDNPKKKTEVLVVSKVGQIGQQDGCVVGLVRASGNAGANDAARKIADDKARGFACGTDKWTVTGEVPDFSRSD
ncbi:hypothetical protein ABMA32_15555 [Mesorhizobium sp. VNQ89]|uniref:hypothetical protein n=1 Tax=Mesorhizobium quangtriensis TaxID=3157709 RepID=UPI0032B8591B